MQHRLAQRLNLVLLLKVRLALSQPAALLLQRYKYHYVYH
jgi:hypothetical protein